MIVAVASFWKSVWYFLCSSSSCSRVAGGQPDRVRRRRRHAADVAADLCHDVRLGLIGAIAQLRGRAGVDRLRLLGEVGLGLGAQLRLQRRQRHLVAVAHRGQPVGFLAVERVELIGDVLAGRRRRAAGSRVSCAARAAAPRRRWPPRARTPLALAQLLGLGAIGAVRRAPRATRDSSLTAALSCAIVCCRKTLRLACASWPTACACWLAVDRIWSAIAPALGRRHAARRDEDRPHGVVLALLILELLALELVLGPVRRVGQLPLQFGALALHVGAAAGDGLTADRLQLQRGDVLIELRQLPVERVALDQLVHADVADGARSAVLAPRRLQPARTSPASASARPSARLEPDLLERARDIARDVRAAVDHVALVDDQDQPVLVGDVRDDGARLVDQRIDQLMLLVGDGLLRWPDRSAPALDRSWRRAAWPGPAAAGPPGTWRSRR